MPSVFEKESRHKEIQGEGLPLSFTLLFCEGQFLYLRTGGGYIEAGKDRRSGGACALP